MHCLTHQDLTNHDVQINTWTNSCVTIHLTIPKNVSLCEGGINLILDLIWWIGLDLIHLEKRRIDPRWRIQTSLVKLESETGPIRFNSVSIQHMLNWTVEMLLFCYVICFYSVFYIISIFVCCLFLEVNSENVCCAHSQFNHFNIVMFLSAFLYESKMNIKRLLSNQITLVH